MNPNAPEHQPDVVHHTAIIRLAREKMFSPPDEETTRNINKRSTLTETYLDVRAFDELADLRRKIRTRNKDKAQAQPLPQFPFFSATPTPDESNGVRLNSRQGLRVLDPDAGTPALCTESYLQFICEYANRWHSRLSGIDHHSAGKDPKFFFFPSHQSFYKNLMINSAEEMAEETSEHLTRAQFWKLRYLFILINFVPAEQTDAHVALCAISPEAKTVDYVCSGGDTGLPNSPRFAGSNCVQYLFAWLSDYLGGTFLPYDWRLRTDAGHVQERSRGDCAIYTVTHAQCLAFGYGISDAFPCDHQKKILNRRQRYVQDLMYQGFADFELGSENTQYYPLLDTKPTALRNEGFHILPASVLNRLPAEIANKRKCYRGCPTKLSLIRHCRRNARFYPGWSDCKISGRGRSLKEFVMWVEDMDAMRHWKKCTPAAKPLPYPEHRPFRWIDPRDSGRTTIPPHALWPRKD
ncbi:uncharacterized protein RSE6_00080 [Rhynchosporium secalis]|uniref:Ubiquitin-like protease family profile domain-containing protein n=1 Tax=Rhynchosporium secalis TaxID=38038 RepID=A0A1E1LW27_RHYSE|nr:uncharacterized protein RSE6_00080 [Rhynchosporium secalis]